MALLNYTSQVSESKTVTEIQSILAKNQAKAILTEYDGDGFIAGIAFRVETAHGNVSIRLPIDVEATLKVLEKQCRVGKIQRRFVTEAQARRTAWRIIKDWLEAQMAILETEMVKMEQIFLPYVVTESGKTLYQAMEEREFRLLPDRKEELN